MGPYVLVAQGVVGQAGQQEVLEEAHVLESEKGHLMLRLSPLSIRIRFRAELRVRRT